MLTTMMTMTTVVIDPFGNFCSIGRCGGIIRTSHGIHGFVPDSSPGTDQWLHQGTQNMQLYSKACRSEFDFVKQGG